MNKERCGKCEACQVVEATKKMLTPNPPFTHANNSTVNCWNKVLADNPCITWTDGEEKNESKM